MRETVPGIMSHWLLTSLSIQPRTGPLKFAGSWYRVRTEFMEAQVQAALAGQNGTNGTEDLAAFVAESLRQFLQDAAGWTPGTLLLECWARRGRVVGNFWKNFGKISLLFGCIGTDPCN